MRISNRRRFVATLLFTTALGGMTSAARAAASDAAVTAPQEVIVTGSRIPRINEKSANPVSVVTSQDAKLQGSVHVEDLLNNLPQVNAGLNGGALGPTGTATVDLRGFGAFRTLVLINGRRLNPGDPINPSADLNSVPAALIKRVEVLTGGASSIYGSDAIAGAVNFVMDDDFTGLRLDGQYSAFQDSNGRGDLQAVARANGFSTARGSVVDGGSVDLSAVFGRAVHGGDGHITLYGGYHSNHPIKASNRDYSACNLTETGAFYDCIRDDNSSPAQFQLSSGQNVTLDPATGNTFRPFDIARDGFNTALYAYLQRPDKRFDAGYFARYQLNKMVQIYSEFQFTDDRTTAQYDPASTALNTFGINCNNPLLSADQVDTICTQAGLGLTDTAQVTIGKRNVEGGPRVDEFHHTAYRVVLGLKGKLNDVWSYDAFGQYGITYSAERLSGDLSLARVGAALNVVSVGGTPTCQSVVYGSDPACVPYNIFKIGGVTPAALNYVTASGAQNGFASRGVVNAVLIGKLGGYGVKSPLADEGVGIVGGGEYRREALRQTPSAAYVSGDLAVTGQQLPLAGAYTVSEVFGEMHVPLIDHRPFMEHLSIDLSDRYAHYSLQGSVNAYKIGGEWAPSGDLRFRGSISRAIRAPNGFELFKANTVAKFQGSDPCAGATPIATLAQCQNSGVTPAQYGTLADTGNFNFLTGGNTRLKPETSKTSTIGVVFTPSFTPGLSFSIDYWNIVVDHYDGQYAPNATLNNCINTGNPIFCSLVQRDAGGSLSLGNGIGSGRVIATNLNTGSFGERGIDLDAGYGFALERLGLNNAGRLRLHFVGSLALQNRIEPIPGGDVFDCTGLYGPTCTGEGPTSPIPNWRHQVRLTWTSPQGIEASLNWRHIGELKSELGSAYPHLSATPFPVDARIKPYDYFDLAFTCDLTKRYNLRVGVDNMLGTKPPVVGSNANPLVLGGNMVASMYDTLGRYMFVGVTAKF